MTFLLSFLFCCVVLTSIPMFRRVFGRAANMSTYTTDKASPFTRAVIGSMRKLYETQTRFPVFYFIFFSFTRER